MFSIGFEGNGVTERKRKMRVQRGSEDSKKGIYQSGEEWKQLLLAHMPCDPLLFCSVSLNFVPQLIKLNIG